MKNAVVAKTSIDIIPTQNPDLKFNAKGEVVIFDGFLKVYGKNKDTLLPQLNISILIILLLNKPIQNHQQDILRALSLRSLRN